MQLVSRLLLIIYFMSSSNIVINNMMSRFNDMAVAGLGVAMKVNMIVVMLLIGLGTGIQPLLGFCFGAGNKKRYMSILKFSLMLAFGLSAVMTVLCYSFAAPLVSAFLENQDAFTYGFSFSRIYIYSGQDSWYIVCIGKCYTVYGCGASVAYSFNKQAGIGIPSSFMYI